MKKKTAVDNSPDRNSDQVNTKLNLGIAFAGTCQTEKQQKRDGKVCNFEKAILIFITISRSNKSGY